MSDDPLDAIKSLQTIHKDDLAILRSLVEAPNTVTIPRAQLEAYRAAAEALVMIANRLECAACKECAEVARSYACDALAALRAAGIPEGE